MHRKLLKICVYLMLIISVPFPAGCSGSSASKNHTGGQRTTVHACLTPEASGTVTYENDVVSIDASNVSEGYLMARYTGDSDKARLHITLPDGSVCAYALSSGSYETFPLTGGNGACRLEVLEHVYNEKYALAFSQDIAVEISDGFKPYLYPNQFVWFTQEHEAVALGEKLSGRSSNDLDYVEQVYLYVTKTIKYDDKLAADVQTGYLPDIDAVLKSKKGICFDHAALMAAMLRSQGIPAKLLVGYAGDAWHAWLNVYLKETGWIDRMIAFDGKNWTLLDPALAASHSRDFVQKYTADSSNYTVKYSY